MKYYAKEQSKPLNLDALRSIALNSGVGLTAWIIKEVIKSYSQGICNNYEWYHEIDSLSKDNNTLPQFAKYNLSLT
ncbi:MAG: hypothetical protein MRQ12_05005 [Candidatus Midichloria mitochondrii]|nr:hypothetical protein [Candidatus Midichloria mitochondrii]